MINKKISFLKIPASNPEIAQNRVSVILLAAYRSNIEKCKDYQGKREKLFDRENDDFKIVLILDENDLLPKK
jgi:hypothetical protein